VTPTHVICANVGDSRCVVGSMLTGSTTSLTEDHKPKNAEEKVRIENGGGFVMGDRVNGELAMSRALGDFRYKRNTELATHEHPVICIPDVSTHKRSGKKDEILVLACDGVFDVMKNSEVVDYLTQIVLADENSENSGAKIVSVNKNVPDKSSGKDKNGKNKNGKDKNGSKEAEEQKSGVTAQEAAESLIDLALAEGSTDNITAVVLRYL
jgi:serine/threonine protein phosphatase PrpC